MKRRTLQKVEPYLWILPSIILMATFIIVPIFYVFRMAFSQVTKTGKIRKPEGYYDETIVREAVAAVERDGFLRSVMTVRFAGVLLKKTWYERQLFYSALFAGDDKNWLIRRMSGFDSNARIYLVGNEGRCRVYKTMIGDCLDCAITVVSDSAQVNRLAVDGARLLVHQYPDVIAKLL